ncbi:hypothetical protein M9458_039251 [Cirrhinus mrigala]|uniref:Integrase catalytic domain-containing protein n=1 Tax=Cirrhinus mrigala TaxID=683832 RepID=A0ABD0NNJ1_CIRMR
MVDFCVGRLSTLFSTHVSTALRSYLYTCLCACENVDFLTERSQINRVVNLLIRGPSSIIHFLSCLCDRMSGPEMVPADLEQLWGVIQQQAVEIVNLRQELVNFRTEITAARSSVRISPPCKWIMMTWPLLKLPPPNQSVKFLLPINPRSHFRTNGMGPEPGPSRYPTDRSRIALLTSLLTGQAAEADGDSAYSYPAFTAELRTAFQHPESEVEVDSRLKYTTEFRTLAVQTTWSDAALRTAYYEGLSTRLKDKLAVRELPATMEGITQLALRDLPATRGLRSHPPPMLSLRLLLLHHGAGEPMQIGRTSLRYREGLCAYFASPDHHRAICPLREEGEVFIWFQCCETLPRVRHFLAADIQVSILLGHQRSVTTTFVDSGAAGNFINQTYAAQLGVVTEVLSQPLNITAIDGRPLTSSPITHCTKDLTLIIGTHSETIKFYVTKISSPPIILGHPWLVTHDPFISWTSNRIVHWGATCQELCLRTKVGTCSGESEASDVDHGAIPVQYRDLAEVFSKRSAARLPPHHPYDLAIDLVSGAVPPCGHLYSLSPKEQLAMEEYVAEGLRAGTIRPSSSPAATGFFFVNKKDGGLRPCVDYRGLNQITIKNRHPLPLTNTALSGAHFFTKLDLRSAYNLVRIREGDEWKTAFITPTGHYETLVMPFGLCNSPVAFQHFINVVLRDMLGRWLLAHQLFCKLEKCAFHQHTTTFLGFVISAQGVAMDPQKLEAVRSWPLPTSLKQLQRFLGFANFYRRFIRGFSSTAAPLTALTKPSRGEFHLTPEAIQAFRTLCHQFTSASPFVVEVDASDVGVGAVLSQRGPDEKLHPCSFFSRKFNPTQQRYGVGDRELLAIKWALEEWRHWLQGGGDPFTVWTVHQNLTVIRQTKQLNPRQAQWALFFEHFNFHLSYRPGSKNTKADALSHQHQKDTITSEPAPVLPSHIILAPIRQELPPSDTPTGRLFVPSALRQEVLHPADSQLHRSSILVEDAEEGRTGVRPGLTSMRPKPGSCSPSPYPNNTILTIVDRFSKAVHLVALTGLPPAKTTTELILEHVVHLHGFPKDIVSDRGLQFTAKFWQAFCRLVGTTSSLSSGFHPQTNGQTERANQQLERYLRCFASEHQRSWASNLIWGELSNNLHTSSTTGLSPFEVCYGFQPPIFEHQEPEVEVPSAQQLVRRCQRLWNHARAAIQKTNQRYIIQHHRRHAPGRLFYKHFL